MTELEFKFDWLDIDGVNDRLISRTMAEFEIRVGEHCITRCFDGKARSQRDRLLVSLYPLAEWMTAHWWPLIEEVEVLHRGSESFNSRHDIAMAGDGFIFPRCRIMNEGENCRIEWRPFRSATSPLSFVEAGSHWVDSVVLRQALYDFVEAVLARLHAQDLQGSWLESEWAAIHSESEDDVEISRLAGRLGLDPYSLDDRQAREIADAAESIPATLHREFFCAIAASETAASRDWLQFGLERIAKVRPIDAWDKLRREMGDPPSGTPWAQGYALAGRLRNKLGMNGEAVELNELVDEPFPMLDASESPHGLEALVGGRAPVCYTQKKRPRSQQFAAARGLCEYLTNPGNDSALLSSASTDRQRRNRAFAAEFLAPASVIRTRMPREVISAVECEEIADQFNVSSYVIEHQIENHRLGSVIKQ